MPASACTTGISHSAAPIAVTSLVRVFILPPLCDGFDGFADRCAASGSSVRKTQDRKPPATRIGSVEGSVAASGALFGADSNAVIDRHAVQHCGTLQPPDIERCPAEQRAETQELYQAENAAAQREIVQPQGRSPRDRIQRRKEFRNNTLAQAASTADRRGAGQKKTAALLRLRERGHR
jgi:hypothetical protein